MVTVVKNLTSGTATNKPTTTGLRLGQIAFNTADDFIFVGDGSNAYTQADGTPGTAPPAGFGFKEFRLSGGGNVFTANAVTKAGTNPTTAELNTAFGNPANLQDNDTGILTAGPDKGIYKYAGTNWIKSSSNLQTYTAASVTKATATAAPTSAELSTAFGSTGLEQENDIGIVTAGEDSGTYVYGDAGAWIKAEAGIQVVDDTTGLADTANATITAAFGNTPRKGDVLMSRAGNNQGIYVHDGTNWLQDPNAGLRVTNVNAVADVAAADAITGADEGDVLIIADTTGLGAQATFNAVTRAAPSAAFTEGANSPIAYIFEQGGTWVVLDVFSASPYQAGNGLIQTIAAGSITFAADFAVAAELVSANNIVGTSNKLLRADSNRALGSLQNVSAAAVATVTAANQTGFLVRDASVANEFDADAWKLTDCLDAGTF